MFKKNNGSNGQDILQNQFTSYLSFAVSNARIDFIRAKTARLKREQTTDQYELLFTRETFELEILSSFTGYQGHTREGTLCFPCQSAEGKEIQGYCRGTWHGRKRCCRNLLPHSKETA